MTYRNKLLFIASRLAAGPLSDTERLDLSSTVGNCATGVGKIERAWDEVVEEARESEIAHWDMAVEPCGSFLQ